MPLNCPRHNISALISYKKPNFQFIDEKRKKRWICTPLLSSMCSIHLKTSMETPYETVYASWVQFVCIFSIEENYICKLIELCTYLISKELRNKIRFELFFVVWKTNICIWYKKTVFEWIYLKITRWLK